MNINDLINEELPELPKDALSATTTNITPMSRTALVLDKWGIRRGQQIADIIATEISKHIDIDDIDFTSVCADMHGVLFNQENTFAPNTTCKSRAKWLQSLMQQDSFVRLRRETMLNTEYSSLASASLVGEYLDYELQNEIDCNNGNGNDNDKESQDDGQDEDNIRECAARARLVKSALDNTLSTIENAKNVCTAVGCEPGQNTGTNNQAITEIFKNIRNSKFFLKIAQYTGRAMAMANSLQRTKLVSDRGGVSGIKLGRDIGTMLPSEQALICGLVPELHTHSLYRMSQSRMLCYSHKSKKPAALGPIVVIVDESGSMGSHNNIHKAKAVALVMCWIASKQKRWSAYLGFSNNDIYSTAVMPANPSDDDRCRFISWINSFIDGGTDLKVPLSIMPQQLWPEWIKSGLQPGKTDVIIITDDEIAEVNLYAPNYKEWARKENVMTYGIRLSHDANNKMSAFCDKVWQTDTFTFDGNDGFLKEVFSI